jgi:hypothetical protein
VGTGSERDPIALCSFWQERMLAKPLTLWQIMR